jgi:hypothetical protein
MLYERGQRTVRELAGEYWSEVRSVEGAAENWELVGRTVDLLLGVLARYDGFVITNDDDIPVTPLPRKTPTGG